MLPRKKAILIGLVLLLACYCGLLAFFIWKIGDREAARDFIRPFIFVCLSLAGVVFLAAAKIKLLRCMAYGAAFVLSLMAFALLVLYRYYKKIEASFTSSDVYALLQSDFAEAKYYVLDNLLDSKALLLGLAVFGLAIILSIASIKVFVPLIGACGYRRLGKIIACVTIAGSLLCLYSVRPVNVFIKAYVQYHRDLQEFNRLFHDISSAPAVSALKHEKGELYVIVIGESESRDYLAENTPWRDSLAGKNNWVIFHNAYAHHTHTVPVLSAALTDGRALSGLTFPRGQHIINLARQAGMRTIWISNQANLGVWDSPVAALASTADKTVFAKIFDGAQLQGPEPDAVLLPIIERELKNLNPQRNNLIIIHLMGSHSPYENRYPANYQQTAIDKRKAGQAALDSKSLYETYSASIRYTDDVLRQIAARIALYNDRPALMMYFADHGEDIFAQVPGHNFSSFTWPMARIPFMLWTSDAYQSQYPERVKNLIAHANDIFTNDLIFDLLMGMANIKTPIYDPEFDISSELYKLKIDNALIAANTAVAADPHWRIRANAVSGQPIAAHRSNTIFKVRQASQLGIRNFEADVLYDPRANQLLLGHDNTSLTGGDLKTYLSIFNDKMDFLWLDIKNIDLANHSAVFEYLSLLDQEFKLKAKVLIESHNPAAIKIFAQNGWQTSYYLPWEQLRDLEKNSSPKFNDALNAIQEKLASNEISGISYNWEIDSLVQRRLKPVLAPELKLYAWNINWNYSDNDLTAKLRNCQHIARLLITFDSPFSY